MIKEFLCEGCGDYQSLSVKVECAFCHTAYCISCYGDMESHPCARKECFEAVRNYEGTFNPSKRKFKKLVTKL